MSRPSSRRPHKQLLFSWLKDELKSSSNYGIGLDVACGYMQFRPLFLTSSYIGVDLDPERVKKASNRYPEATAVHSSIEDMNPEIRGDFVICIQTIGTNALFNTENTTLCIQKLLDATNEGGALLFNIGPFSSQYIPEIERAVRDSFASVNINIYGAFSKRVPPYLTKMLSYAMKKFEFLRKPQNKSEIRYFFICSGKK